MSHEGTPAAAGGRALAAGPVDTFHVRGSLPILSTGDVERGVVRDVAIGRPEVSRSTQSIDGVQALVRSLAHALKMNRSNSSMRCSRNVLTGWRGSCEAFGSPRASANDTCS